MKIWSTYIGVLPIRKIKPNVVALSSYYGKVFVSRASKKADNSTAWVAKKITLMGMDTDSNITNVSPSDSYDNTFKAPYIYSSLSSSFSSFQVRDLTIMLNRKKILETVDDNLLKKLEDNTRVVGIDGGKGVIVVDYNDVFHLYLDGKFTELGDIYTLLDLPVNKAPMDITELRVFRKHIPLGVVLSYYFGLEGMLKLIGVKYTTTDELRYRRKDNEYVVKLADKTYIFNRDDKESSLIIAGLNKFSKILIRLSSEDMEGKDAYFNIISSMKLGPIYIRELDLVKDMFIDSITLSILEEMNEPTTFIGLLLKSNTLLMNFNHPDSQDMYNMRVRGYERMAGLLYSELIQSIRAFRNTNLAGRSKINMGHYAVWSRIVRDNSVKLVEQTNPIQNLKEIEVLTYSGDGGRSTETLNRASRAFHKTDLGVISEATVDSSAVGVNTYLSANPNFSSLRGIIKKDAKLDNGSLYSTSFLMAPGSIYDD